MSCNTQCKGVNLTKFIFLAVTIMEEDPDTAIGVLHPRTTEDAVMNVPDLAVILLVSNY